MSAWDWELGEDYLTNLLQDLDIRMTEKHFARPYRTGFVYDERMLRHYCTWNADYTEVPDRLSRSYQRCEEYGLVERCHRIQARFASHEEMTILHDEELVLKLKTTATLSTQEMKQLSQKYDFIYFHPAVYDNSRLALGSSIELVDHVLSKQVRSHGFQLMIMHRPPGHHAMRSRFCGYCYLNNVATAAQFALDKYGLDRVLIVDWDVHHGQGTQYMFYDDPRVLYFSIHRHEHGAEWPNLDEAEYSFIGQGAGQGYNINVPLNVHGCGDSDYMAIILQILLPVAFEFNPQLILVSAGYDAALGCPEGEMQVSPAFFPNVINLLSPLADGQICLFLEGGYCLQSLAEGVALSLRALLGDPCPSLGPLSAPCSSVRESILNCLKVHRCYWKSLGYQGMLDVDELPEYPSLLQWPSLGSQDRATRETFSLDESCYEESSNEVIAGYVRKLEHWISELRLRQTQHRVCLGYSRMSFDHRSPDSNHPECPQRIDSIISTLEKWSLLDRCYLSEERCAVEEELTLAHSQSHVSLIEQSASCDEETLNNYRQTFNSVFLNKDTNGASRQAVGTLLSVVDAVMEDKTASGVAIIRPPGHHAEEAKPMGFCIFNNIAIAAKYALSKFGLKRILILDWDVHHGNGTQQMFYDEERVLYMSMHRFDDGTFFPAGSNGHFTNVGDGPGEGFNVNIPWRQGRMGDSEYLAAFQQVVLPIAYEFCPDLVLVSAGYDAARGDALGGYKLSPQCFAVMTRLIMGLAHGRIVLALEGGYNLEMTSASLALCTSVLLGDPCPSLLSPMAPPCPSALETIMSVLQTQKEFWKILSFCVNLPSQEQVMKMGGLELTGTTADGMKNLPKADEQEVCSAMSSLTVNEEKTAET